MYNFYSDVIVRSPWFNAVTRICDPSYLEPATRKIVQEIMQESAKLDQPLMLYETYRSPARQQYLFERGMTELATLGVHHYGLAADLVHDVNGQPSWQGDFQLLGELAFKHGLVWGGTWRNPVDLVHVQRCAVADQPRLFAGTWYPDPKYVATAPKAPKTPKAEIPDA